ncbi:unnamed protein product, partial [Candidula unifasciata]
VDVTSPSIMLIYALLVLMPAVSLAAKVNDFVTIVLYVFDQNKNNQVDFGEYMNILKHFTDAKTNEVKCVAFPIYKPVLS